jgi:membrane associated rhomboid family serine protease
VTEPGADDRARPDYHDREGERMPLVTIVLICINVLVFLFTGGPSKDLLLGFYTNLADPSILSIVTSLFLHGSWAQLLSNVLALCVIGVAAEKRLKPLTCLMAYLICGVAGSYAQVLYYDSQAIYFENFTFYILGASGAISGLIGLTMVLAGGSVRSWITAMRVPQAKPMTGKGAPFVWLLLFIIAVVQMVVVNMNIQTIAFMERSVIINYRISVFAEIGGVISGIMLALLIIFLKNSKLGQSFAFKDAI